VLANGLGVAEMRNLIIGIVIGIVIATIGFSGVARLLDRGVQTIQQTTKELAQ
jgi:capsular polysaccharide biosynthesis protein